MDFQTLINQIVPIVITGFLIPLAIEGIRWLRAKANQNAFLSKLNIDDTLFEVAEDTVRTMVPDLAKAGTTLDAVQHKQAMGQLIERMRAHGVNVWQTHGERGISEVLDQALASLKVADGQAMSHL